MGFVRAALGLVHVGGEDLAVFQAHPNLCRAKVAGVCPGLTVHLPGGQSDQLLHRLPEHRLVGKGTKGQLPIDKRQGHDRLQAELGLQSGAGPLMDKNLVGHVVDDARNALNLGHVEAGNRGPTPGPRRPGGG